MTGPTTVAPRGGGHRARRRRRVLLAVVVLVVVLAAPATWWMLQAYPLGSPGPEVAFYVSNGESIGQVDSALASHGIISSSLAFRIDLMFNGTPNVTPGWYSMRTSSSFSAVRAALGNGPNALVVDFTPGETAREMSYALGNDEDQAFAAAFRRDVKDGAVSSTYQDGSSRSLEGLLAPGTYLLTHGEQPTTLIAQMVARFEHAAAALGLSPTTHDRGLDAYELVTVASIVEKEGYYPRNMPKTATVIFNRLARGTPLQMDSTVEYAIGKDGGPVTAKTERIHSRYNTYLYTGLTPTPICTPSTIALRSALHPPSGPWLFFTVVTQSGTMAFATTFAQQLANERLAAQHGVP